MKQRVELIDSLRGFSLLGILLANLLIFQYGMVGKDYLENLSIVDTVSYYFTKIFIETSFMPIFTFLFGYSLIKFVESIKKRQPKTRWVLIRRAIGLLVLGGIHSTFIWEGDILLYYGGVSFILLFFIYRKPKTLLIWAGVIFIFFTAISYGPEIELYDPNKIDSYLAEDMKVYSTGSYAEIKEYRQTSEMPIKEEDMGIVVVGVLLAPIIYLPLFFVGMAFAKLNVFRNPDNEKPLYRWMALLAVVGIVMKILGQMDSNVAGMMSMAGGSILSVGYIGIFALFYNVSFGGKLKSAFAAVGKLSLSNYLLQSVICTLVFYGYGLGLYGSLGVTLGLVVGVVIYGCQLYFSQLYLKVYTRGPVEMLLRLWTNLSWRKKDVSNEIIQPQAR